MPPLKTGAMPVNQGEHLMSDRSERRSGPRLTARSNWLRRWASAFSLACLAVLAVSTTASAGPVILGGDDLTDHGGVDGSGNNVDGWLYIERAIGNMKPNVTRPNDNSIAAIGSSAAGGGAGSAITSAAQKNGMTLQYFDGAAAINTAFAGIADGSYQPAIVWVSGDGAGNDLSGCEGPGTEGQAITDNTPTLDRFVSEGGGLMSHGSCYSWLSALLPGLIADDSNSSDSDLYLTGEGQAALPGLTNADVNAGPWHNFFDGNFGGLQVLVRSGDVDDSAGNDAAVVLGGGNVGLVTPPVTPPVTPVPPTPQAAACSNTILGDSQGNNLSGTSGPDFIKGLLGNDSLDGLAGDDCVRGGPGSDNIKGGDGADQLNGGQKRDKVDAGGGDDLIKVRAGQTDVVSCGGGQDTVRAGKNDKIGDDCENIQN